MKNITKAIFTVTAATSCVAFAEAMQEAPHSTLPAKDPNPSARWGVKDGANLFMTAEALVFKFSQDAEAFAYKTNSTNTHTTTYAAYADYQWGFRVAGGYNISHDRWDLVATYTRFANSATHTVKDDASSTLTSNAHSSESINVNAVADSWKYNYNVLDVELGRQFFVSKHLRLRPKFGLRNLWLWNRQGITNTLTTTSSAPQYISARSNFWGMGVLAGLDSVWNLGEGFSIYGNVSMAGLFGYVNPKSDIPNYSGQEQYRTHHRDQTKAVFDYAIGFRWDRNFSDDRFHIGFNAGFEQHVYINMAQNFMNGIVYQQSSGASGRDFSMSGFAFGGRFDY